ncbi:universal stress protein UspA [Methanoculleus taiwanensis]|uniref:Universal stress protein UspA n=1 Tax=Methanoculleus taiwanensis TaxID=1550565 RepID=A0A498H1P3_9EURY|nr:STAS/SEC14 domain-containing protein [Methanoculleus taiwanensis]RXE56752.1 universal stress protein UspA [Methanoculleus taiwanensis]
MLDRMKESSGCVVGFRFDGKLSESDYRATLLPEIEKVLETCDHARILLKIERFHSWRPGGYWEELKTWPGIASVDRIAIVGGEQWREWMTHLPGLFVGFTNIDVRYFRESRQVDAWGWLGRDEPQAAPREAIPVQSR